MGIEWVIKTPEYYHLELQDQPKTPVRQQLPRGKIQVCNAVEKGILDHMETKRWAMRFTLDAVLTVLKALDGTFFTFDMRVVLKVTRRTSQ